MDTVGDASDTYSTKHGGLVMQGEADETDEEIGDAGDTYSTKHGGLVMQGEADETDEEIDQPVVIDEELPSDQKLDTASSRSTESNASENNIDMEEKNLDSNRVKSFMQWKFKSINLALQKDFMQQHSKCCIDATLKMNKICGKLDVCQSSASNTSYNIRESMSHIENATKRMSELYQFAEEALPNISFCS